MPNLIVQGGKVSTGLSLRGYTVIYPLFFHISTANAMLGGGKREIPTLVQLKTGKGSGYISFFHHYLTLFHKNVGTFRACSLTSASSV